MKTHYHKGLDAKLVLSDKIVISLDTEFIENENEDVSKQDCEITAAELVMKICRQKKWRYIYAQGRQKLLDESYEWVRQGKGSMMVSRIGKEKCIMPSPEEIYEIVFLTVVVSDKNLPVRVMYDII